MPTKLITCAFIFTIAYLIIFDHVDCASVRKKTRKGDLSKDTPGNVTRLKVDGQPSSLSDAVGIGIVLTPIAASMVPDLSRQNNSITQNTRREIQNSIQQAKKQRDGDDRAKSNIEADLKGDDAGAGFENAERLGNGGVKNVIENIMNENLAGKISKERKNDVNREALRFKSESKATAKSVSLRPGKRSSLTLLKIDELQLPDHVDGMRMEHDGHLNREYKQEVLLGSHAEFEWESESKLVDRLTDIFKRADKNQDSYIDLTELQSWIMFNVQNHLDEAVADNKRIFSHLDSNNDSFVTWKEFYIHFLLAKGHDLDNAEKQSNDYETIPLDPDEKERIIRYKFRWAEADEDPQDDRLTFDEFMNFRHPEQSKAMLVRMVKDLINNFDKNGDDLITEEEFLMISSNLDSEIEETDNRWLIERKKEFQDVIDINKDGIVNEAEFKVYVDPHNSNLAKLEAENLIRLADNDRDGRLSLTEVLENDELFLGSKVVDASRNFHDEF